MIDDSNQNIIISPDGTGKVDVAFSRIINGSAPVDDTDFVTKSYVDSVLGSGLPILTTNTTTAIPTVIDTFSITAYRTVKYIVQLSSNNKYHSIEIMLIHDGTTPSLYLPGIGANYASTPNATPLQITGDIDVRVKVALDDWTPAVSNTLIAKMSANNTRSFTFIVGTDGGPNACIYISQGVDSNWVLPTYKSSNYTSKTSSNTTNYRT